MTSPPAQHDPADDGPRREDADAHPPLGQIEAGPQRHSDDPFEQEANLRTVEIMLRLNACGDASNVGEIIIKTIAAALRAVDRAAREECARMAEATFRGVNIAARIRSTIKP